MESQSKEFVKFRRGKEAQDDAAGGEGAGAESPEKLAQRKSGEDQDINKDSTAKRSASAGGWDVNAGDNHRQIMTQLRQEYYGSSAEENNASGNEADASLDQHAQGVDGIGESGDDYGGSNADDSALYDENDRFISDEQGEFGGDYSPSQQQGDASFRSGSHVGVSKQDVARRRVVGGTVSGYKNKRELQETLERKAALKYIRERREDVGRRARVLQEADEKVAVIKSHIDEIESKTEQMKYVVSIPCVCVCVKSVVDVLCVLSFFCMLSFFLRVQACHVYACFFVFSLCVHVGMCMFAFKPSRVRVHA